MTGIDFNYYKKQLDIVNVKNNLVRFKVMNDNTSTNVMNLNLESIEALEIWIKESKKILLKLKEGN